MRSRFARTLLGVGSFFAPAYVAVAGMTGEIESTVILWLGGTLGVLVGAVVPAALFLKSQLPPNTRMGMAIVAVTLVVAECLSIAYINWVSGLTP